MPGGHAAYPVTLGHRQLEQGVTFEEKRACSEYSEDKTRQKRRLTLILVLGWWGSWFLVNLLLETEPKKHWKVESLPGLLSMDVTTAHLQRNRPLGSTFLHRQVRPSWSLGRSLLWEDTHSKAATFPRCFHKSVCSGVCGFTDDIPSF